MTILADTVRPRVQGLPLVTLALALLLVVMTVASLGWGASSASLWGALGDLAAGRALDPVDRVVLWSIRAPRTVTAILVGAGLAVSGAVLQGLFRNPLADPGIVGVTQGASLGAIGAIVLGGLLPLGLRESLGTALLPTAAFLGSWIAILVLYRLATLNGQTSVATMLLGGIALGAFAVAISGYLIFVSDDAQLRDLTFWGLGSLSGATWGKTALSGAIIVLALLPTAFLARGLNGLAMGEAVAGHMGVPVERVKTLAILSVAGATGAAVAVSGGIAFVGIIVPHTLRLAQGPDHRRLLPNAALLGGALLLAADMISRTVVAPAELPIGIVTATLGAPFLLAFLMRRGAEDGSFS